MNTNLLVAALVAVAAPAFAQFHFDAPPGTCVHAADERGLNVGIRGDCSDFANGNLTGQALCVHFRRARLDRPRPRDT